MIGCLAYAGDIKILSKTSEGLQKLMQVLEKFCISWKMTVNIKNEMYYISKEK